MDAVLAPEPTAPTVTGSHAVDIDGDRCVIRNVELFSEKAKDTALGKVDRAMLDRITAHTNRMAANGRRTQIVLRHASKDEPADQQSYGTIRNLWVGEANGTVYIYGDLHMRQHELYTLERYPRRSAEIYGMADGQVVSLADGDWDDLWLGNLALLGRETPGADIPDLSVSLNGGTDHPAVFLSEVPAVTFGTTQEPDMDIDKKAVQKFIDDMDEKDRKAFLAGFSEDEKPAEDEKKKPDESKSSAESAPAATAAAESVDFASDPRFVAMQAQIGQLKQSGRENSTRDALRSLADKGVVFSMDDELARCAAIIDDEARAAEFSRMEKNYARTQTPRSLMHASQGAAQFAGAAQPATDQALTSVELSQISTKAAEFASNDGLSTEEATHKAAESLGLSDKLKAYAG